MALHDFVLVEPPIGGAYKCRPNLKAYRLSFNAARVQPRWSAVPEHRPTIFLNLYGILNSGFRTSFFFFFEKRLDLKSLKGQLKAKELGDQVSELLSFRLPLKAF